MSRALELPPFTREELRRLYAENGEIRDLVTLRRLFLTDPETGDPLTISSPLGKDKVGNGCTVLFNVTNPKTGTTWTHIFRTVEHTGNKE